LNPGPVEVPPQGGPDREVKANPCSAELKTHVKRVISKRMQVRIFRYFFDMFIKSTFAEFLLNRFKTKII
jgi:hypothetical protein